MIIESESHRFAKIVNNFIIDSEEKIPIHNSGMLLKLRALLACQVRQLSSNKRKIPI